MSNFSIANLSEAETKELYEVEKELKQKTGKNYVLIAWEAQ